MAEAFHLIAETPPNSGEFTETGEVVTSSYEDAVLRCVELSQTGTRFGWWVEST